MRYYNICVKLSQRTPLARSTSMGSRAPGTLARGFGARAHRRLRELTAAPRATHLLPPCPSAHRMVGQKPTKTAIHTDTTQTCKETLLEGKCSTNYNNENNKNNSNNDVVNRDEQKTSSSNSNTNKNC